MSMENAQTEQTNPEQTTHRNLLFLWPTNLSFYADDLLTYT